MSKFKVALIQLFVGANKAENVKNAIMKIGEAAKNGAELVVLPECFNSPYGNDYFAEYAETIPGETTSALQSAAKSNNVDLIGGTIPERFGEKVYNCSTIFNRKGDFAGKFRKIHLFDINVPGKITFQESKTLTAGQQPVIFQTDRCKIGLEICYDIRFIELARLYANAGCQMVVCPGAFNMTTGPAHWELIARSSAISHQIFTLMCSPARDPNAKYVAWGHSMVVDPWGTILAQADEKETILYADIDLSRVEEVRQSIPITMQRRNDIYDFVVKREIETIK